MVILKSNQCKGISFEHAYLMYRADVHYVNDSIILIFIRPFEKTVVLCDHDRRAGGGTNDVRSLTQTNIFRFASNFGIMFMGIISRPSSIMSYIGKGVQELCPLKYKISPNWLIIAPRWAYIVSVRHSCSLMSQLYTGTAFRASVCKCCFQNAIELRAQARLKDIVRQYRYNMCSVA